MTKQNIQGASIGLFVIGIMFCGSCGMYPESTLYLSQSSDLPDWILNDPAFPGGEATDDLRVRFDFYGSSSVIIHASSESSGLNIQLKGEYRWIDQNVGGDIGSQRQFSITVNDELVVFSQEIGKATFISVAPLDESQPEK